MAGIAAGKHSVTVHDPIDDRVRDVPVMVGENATATLRVVLKPTDAPLVEEPVSAFAGMEGPEDQQPSNLRRIIGWSSIGLALGLTGATIYSWVRIGNINDDPELQDYRAQFPPDVSDVCLAGRGRAAGPTEARARPAWRTPPAHCATRPTRSKSCSTSFSAARSPSAGIGTYLLLTDPKRQQTVSLRPSFRHGQAMLRASVQF